VVNTPIGFNNSLELVLKFGSRQLLAIVNGIDDVELVVAYNSDMGILDGVIGVLNISRLDGNTAVIKHVLVGVHAHGFTLGKLGLEGLPIWG
jgi:hypothetical protein